MINVFLSSHFQPWINQNASIYVHVLLFANKMLNIGGFSR